jgi:serine/threonine-protein kinase
MGAVYLALETIGGKRVPLKTIISDTDSDPVVVERFLREAEILRQLDHPHIVQFQGMGEANGSFFFAMDYIPGTSADQLLKSDGPLPVRRAVRLICQTLEALEYAHAKGFVHRDIKPANLLISDPGQKESVRVADFGLARLYQHSQVSGLTMSGDWGGTVAYMPPEQITNFRDARPAADQYSTAATLYTLLTDKHVYDFPPRIAEQLALILNDDPVSIRSRRADLPAKLAQAVHRALAREPKHRFDHAGAMRNALLPFCT